ncbi:MAG: hypothetical protein COT06_08245 [Syntrophobacteraceae bacterium CG07_land_8_20_14_0_80_61_8]|nr:MAG: hypothetical protein COT06_08245 [Syntrophobacteraceae bacterium CG07_land_8_20_14_0_80_61_8]
MIHIRFARAIMPLVLSALILLPMPTRADEPDQSQPQTLSPTEALAERARLYWGYKVAGELERAYPLEDPRAREKLTLKDYLDTVGGGVKWLDAQIGAVNLEQDPALVTVTLKFAMMMGTYSPQEGRIRILEDKWVLLGNQWYHYLKTREARPKRKGDPITVRKSPEPGQLGNAQAIPDPSKGATDPGEKDPTPTAAPGAAVEAGADAGTATMEQGAPGARQGGFRWGSGAQRAREGKRPVHRPQESSDSESQIKPKSTDQE